MKNTRFDSWERQQQE